jgi:hypothetical protein
MKLLQRIYAQGCKTASHQLGINADAFVQFANEDPTVEHLENQKAPPMREERPVHWSGAANVQGGDTGTRNEQMGLPRSQSV